MVLGRIGKAAGQPQNLQNLHTDLRQLPVHSAPSFFLKPCVITHRARHVGELGPADAWSWRSDSNAEPQKSNLPWGRSGRYVKIRGNKQKGGNWRSRDKEPGAERRGRDAKRRGKLPARDSAVGGGPVHVVRKRLGELEMLWVLLEKGFEREWGLAPEELQGG